MFYLCSGCLRKALELRRGEGSLPGVALLLLCSFVATKTDKTQKKQWCESHNLWIHHDDSSNLL